MPHRYAFHKIKCKSFVFRWSLIFMNYDFVHILFFPSHDGVGAGAIEALHSNATTQPIAILFLSSSSSSLFCFGFFFSSWCWTEHFTLVPLGTYIFNNFLIWLNWFVSIQLRHYLLFSNLNVMRLLFMTFKPLMRQVKKKEKRKLESENSTKYQY